MNGVSKALLQQVLDMGCTHGLLDVWVEGEWVGKFGHQSVDDVVKAGERAVKVVANDSRMISMVLLESDIGLGEAFMQGLYTAYELLPGPNGDIIENQDSGLVALLDVMAQNLASVTALLDASVLSHLSAGKFKIAAASALYWVGNSSNAVRHALNANTVGGSRANIENHYDLGNSLYTRFLDPSLSYSCGIHTPECGSLQFGPDSRDSSNPNHTRLSLHDAQMAKLDAVIARAAIKDGDRILEIGCGWGSFALRVASRFPNVRYTGITISREQLEEAQARIKDAGFDDRLEVVLVDYRSLGISAPYGPGSFDAVVSIEMLEAVGHEFLPEYFTVVDRVLAPGGSACVQVIGIPDERYEAYNRGSDFIRRYIFPGGHLPSLASIEWAISETSLQWKDTHDIGPDYALTLADWHENFVGVRDWVVESLGIRFYRMWLFYFAYCEVGFAQRVLHDWHLVMHKPVPAAQPSPTPGASATASAPTEKRVVPDPMISPQAEPLITPTMALALVVFWLAAGLMGSHLMFLASFFVSHLAFTLLKTQNSSHWHALVTLCLWVLAEIVSGAMGTSMDDAAVATAAATTLSDTVSSTMTNVDLLASLGMGVYASETIILLSTPNAPRGRLLALVLMHPWMLFVLYSGVGTEIMATVLAASEFAMFPLRLRPFLRSWGSSFVASSPLKARISLGLVWALGAFGLIFVRLWGHVLVIASLFTAAPHITPIIAMAGVLASDLNDILWSAVDFGVDVIEARYASGSGRDVQAIRSTVAAQ